jgi:alkanesulfonate monooxygenase SsuD/methylene tetrahydromethanopterin reductase-like flavin-dependent oxidoreductase (luciferase family)
MTPAPQFGLTLPNRGVLFGVETIEDLIQIGVEAEHTGAFRSLWVGDSLYAKRRPDSIVLLAALAARTRRIRLAVGCMASFPVRHPALLASQWASLDLVAGPDRLILGACIGGRDGGGDWEMENDVFGVTQGSRVGRLEEGVEILRRLFTEDEVSHHGKYYQFERARLEPRPVTRPHPAIWIVSNPRPANGDQANFERAMRRIARLGDGWMTTNFPPKEFRRRWELIQGALEEASRDPRDFDNSLYYNVNINADREAAAAESARFLEAYYGRPFSRQQVDEWVAYGSPQEVIDKIGQYVEAGAKEITLRPTAWNQREQLARLVGEVIPAFAPAQAKGVSA